jgi:hypothetical protein
MGHSENRHGTGDRVPGRREFFMKSAAALAFLNLPYGNLFAEDADIPQATPFQYGNMFVMESAPGPETVIRASIFSEHTPEQINRLLDEMKKIG